MNVLTIVPRFDSYCFRIGCKAPFGWLWRHQLLCKSPSKSLVQKDLTRGTGRAYLWVEGVKEMKKALLVMLMVAGSAMAAPRLGSEYLRRWPWCSLLVRDPVTCGLTDTTLLVELGCPDSGEHRP